MSSPVLTYVKQNGDSIEISYAHLPPSSSILLVNNTSGARLQNTRTSVAEGGKGNLTIAIGAPAGQYHFVAEDTAQKVLAQTVPFYIS